MSRRAIAIVAGCVALVLAVVAALPFTPAMPVDDVNVEGAVNPVSYTHLTLPTKA